MAKNDEMLGNELELRNGSIQQLIDGMDPLSLKAELESRLDTQLAARIFQSAFSRYSAAKESGSLHELQYDLHFSKRSSGNRERAGLSVLILGVLLTAISFYMALPGATYTIYVGLIAFGVWLLISS
jgi:hypothetical protein